MRKILLVLFMALLMTCTVFAVGPNYKVAQSMNQNQDGNATMDGETAQVRERAQVTGLENAMLRVRNEEQKQNLEKILEKIQERKKERLNQVEDLEITESEDGGNLEAVGKKQARLLGILPMKKQVKYQISNEGEITYQKGPWDGFFVFEEDPQI